MGKGYTGKILRANLTERKLSVDEPDEKFYRMHLGGRGTIAHTLLKELKPGIDPLGPENKLIFASGVASGHTLAGSSRNSVGAKSPASLTYGEAQVGGFFPTEFKRAGFDAIIVEGKADRPVYLWLNDGQAEIRDASALWGKTTAQTEDLIRSELGNDSIKVSSIGPGGENLSRVACVMNDLHFAAGRGGLGAVMGSKNLKAVAARGTKAVEMADPDRVRAVNRWLAENFRTISRGMHTYGTGGGGMMLGMSVAGGLPTRNFRESTFEGTDKIHPDAWLGTINTHMDGCFACPIRCKRNVKVEEARFSVDPRYGGPEYETLAALGSLCGVDDLNAVCKGNELCGAYSLDTIAAGNVIAFAMECFEAGLITEKDTDGVKLTFGNADAMLLMIEKIARRQGLGDILAEGVARAAEKIGGGAEKFAIHVKGTEAPMHEPRWKRALSLGYAMNVIGADHCHAIHDTAFVKWGREFEEVLGSLGPFEPMPLEELSIRKARLHTYICLLRTLNNSLVTCQFLPYTPEQNAEIIRGLTGWNLTVFEMLKVAERNYTMARAFNAREGFRAKDDTLPERYFTPFESGPLTGVQVDREKFEEAKLAHYTMMGWDQEGVPTRAKLEELGVPWVADELAKVAVAAK